MVDKQLIEKSLIEKKIPKMKFYELLGMTGKGYNQMFETNSIKVSTLFKIAEILGMPFTDLLTVKVEPKEGKTVSALQTKLMNCLEGKEELYKELIKSEKEKVQLLKEYLSVKTK